MKIRWEDGMETIKRSGLFAPTSFRTASHVLCLLGSLGPTARIASAAESVVPITPPGSTDVDQALLPPIPGWYGGFGALPYSQNTKLYDSEGHAVPAYKGIKISVPIIVAAVVYVYPFHPLGWTIASTFVQPFEKQSYSVGQYFQQTQSGAGDAYSDIFVASKNVGLFGATPGALRMPYGLNISVGYAMIVPDGHYEADKPLTLSGNIWVPDPNLAATWNSGPRLSLGDNTQLSAKVFYAIPLRNPTTHYTSGNILDVDMSATEQFGPYRLGVAGSYQTQITADATGTGVALPNGNRYSEALIGPVAEYFFPSGAFIKAKYQDTFYHRNYVDQRFILLQGGFRF